MNFYLKRLIERNQEEWNKEVDEEIERRNKWLHALKTLIILNEYITGKRKEKWLREIW